MTTKAEKLAFIDEYIELVKKHRIFIFFHDCWIVDATPEDLEHLEFLKAWVV